MRGGVRQLCRGGGWEHGVAGAQQGGVPGGRAVHPADRWPGRDWGGGGRWQLSVKSDILWKSIMNHLFQIRTVKVILQWFSSENKV